MDGDWKIGFSMKLVNVKVALSKTDSDNVNRTLELRYLLADTIEERGLGQIENEGIGEHFIEVSFITEKENDLINQLEGLLLSLGFTERNEIQTFQYP